MYITNKVVSLNSVHGEVYSIQHYVMKFVSDLRQVCGFHRVSSVNKTDRLDITELLLKVALNTIIQTTSLTLDCEYVLLFLLQVMTTSILYHKLSIYLEDFDEKSVYANYSLFMIGEEYTNYVLSISSYSGSSDSGNPYLQGIKDSVVPHSKRNLTKKIKVITKLPNSEQSYKGKVKTHYYINRQNQSTTGKL